MVNYDIGTGSGNDSKNSGGSGSGSGGSTEAQNLKMTSYAAIDGTLAKVFPTASSYGQSIALVMEDVELVDGALYDRGDGVYKLFSWRELGFEEGEEVTADMAPARNSEKYNRTYKYKLIDARVDDADDAGDPIPIGDVIMFEGTSQNRPKSSAKNIARTLTDKGRAAVLDENSKNDWLDTSIELRDDLEGVEVRYFKIERPGEEHNFDLPVFTHKALDERITIDKSVDGTDETEATGDDSEAADDVDAAADVEAEPEAAPATDGGFHPDVQEFVDTVRDMEITDEGAIRRMLDSMIESGQAAFTADMIEGREDEIIAAVQG